MFANLLIITLLLIAGINIMTTMFFSVKNRIYEIGIKKALGATKIDIINQFATECIILTRVSAIIAIGFSVIAACGVEYLLCNYLFINLEIQYSVKNIVFPLCVAELYGFLFCMIPCIYGAKIQVTDALRFE